MLVLLQLTGFVEGELPFKGSEFILEIFFVFIVSGFSTSFYTQTSFKVTLADLFENFT